MEPLITSRPHGGGLTRRQMMMLGAVNLAGLVFPLARGAQAALKDDLLHMSALLQMGEREGPLLVFRDFVADADVEVERHIKRELARRSDLLTVLKKKLGAEKQVRLSVEEIQVRLMFVPQRQDGAAAAYHRYCLAVTDFLFQLGRKQNIFSAITSPDQSRPPLTEKGVCAFLVHRLAKEYQAVCRFSATSGRHVKYKVRGSIFSNFLGAVDLTIEMLAPGQFGLRRTPFTIWQNSGNGMATLMALPVEESLHYWLGTATDRQIAAAMQTHPPGSLAEAQGVAEEWMAIEESVVGGLVEQVLERYCAEHHTTLPVSVGEEMSAAIASLHQYRYREQGIKLVHHLGFQEALAMYMQSPQSFREQLMRAAKA